MHIEISNSDSVSFGTETSLVSISFRVDNRTVRDPDGLRAELKARLTAVGGF